MPEEKKVEGNTEAKPKKKGIIRSFFKSFIDVKKWSSYDEVSANTKSTVSLFRRLFSLTPEADHQETYEEAVARLNLDETMQHSRKKTFLYSALIYFVFALGLSVYFIYLVINRHWFAAIFDLILTCLMFVIAYHEHFWYMQMQKKKLGCNFYDWISFVLRRNK